MQSPEKRQVFAWAMCDFANSAYGLTAATAILPAYFVSAAAPDGIGLFGQTIAASSLWAFANSLAAMVSFAMAPVLGAIADASGTKRLWLLAFSLMGGLATMAAVLPGGDGAAGALFMLGMYVIAQIMFIGNTVFYDAFLPHVTTPERFDRISARGYSFGYVGGGAHFALALTLMLVHARLGLSESTAARLAAGSSGGWWILFSLPALLWLRETAPWADSPPVTSLGVRQSVRQGLARIRQTFAAARRDRNLLTFFVAYLFYNDGVNTVITMASAYGAEELRLTTQQLMVTLLVIQGVAFVGAEVFGRLADRVGAKRALTVSLCIWVGVAVYGWWMRSFGEFLFLGVMVGTVLGGSQSLSRSMFAAMIPAKDSAQYFGYFSVMTRLSAIMGPTVYGVTRQLTGSARPAVLSLATFFIVGLTLLQFVKQPDRQVAR